MTNALVHKVEIKDSRSVETSAQLIDCLTGFTSGDLADDYLDETYVVETIVETLSDGSEKCSIRVRLAERA